MKQILAALLVLVAALAGCTDEPAPEPKIAEPPCPSSPYEDEYIQILNTTDDPIDENRDEHQWDFDTYNFRTCDLYVVGHTALRFAPNGSDMPHGYIGELDLVGDLGVVAVLGAGGETPTAYILDTSDRANPVVLSSVQQTNVYMTDVKLSTDGRFLVTASQRSLTTVNAGELEELPEPTANGGFTVYDITNPADPGYLFTVPDPQGGCHMLEVEYVATTMVVMCISANVRVWGFEEVQPKEFVPLGFVDYFPVKDGQPTPGSNYVPIDPTCSAPTGCAIPASNTPHDMTVTRDEDGTWMTVSHWNDGVRLVDISDAPQATEVGSWNGEGATHYDGNVHTAMTFWVDGVRYTMASPEYTYNGQIPGLWLLDATNPGNLNLVGEWYHPGNHTSHGLYLTTHQWQVAPTGKDVPIEDVHVYLTMNHGGVWVLGFKEILENDWQGAIKGFHLSRTPLIEEEMVTGNAVLNTWDVNVVDGYIYGTDRATGVWVFDWTGDNDITGVTGFA